MKKPGLTAWIVIAMVAGVIAGLIVHYSSTDNWKDQFSTGMSVVTDIFLRLIKMIIAPLVFSTLVTGIAKLGDIRAVGRIGGKTLLWFLCASLISLLLGLVIMNIVQLGHNLHLAVPETPADRVVANALTLKNFISHVFPQSFIEAMANNEILQIVVFSILFGIATAAIGEKGKIIIHALESLAEVILKLTGYIMHVAPLAAFSAIASILALK